MNINTNLYDGYEVHPCRLVMKNGTVVARGSTWQPRLDRWIAVEVNHEQDQHPEHTWFWCLYGHGFSGGLTDIADAPTKDEVLSIASYLNEHKLLPPYARLLSAGDFSALFRYSRVVVHPFKLAKRGGSSIYFKRGMHVRHGMPSEATVCAPDDKHLFAYGLYGVLSEGEWLQGRRPSGTAGPSESLVDDRGKEEHLLDFATADEAERAACYVATHGVLPPILKWLR